MRSNFSFVKKVDEKCYEKLLEIERKVKIDSTFAGERIRSVLEYLVEYKQNEYGLFDYVKELRCKGHRTGELAANIYILRDGEKKIYNYILHKCNKTYVPLPSFKIGCVLGCKKSSLPDLESGVDVQNGIENEYADNFLRQLGNKYKHIEKLNTDIKYKTNYKNVICALKVLQEYVRIFYNIDKSKVDAFSEDIMPIDNYEIEKEYVPSDKIRTGCDRELIAKRYEPMANEFVGYSLVRQYEYEVDNSVLLRRATDVFRMGDNCGDLLEKVVILSDGNKYKSPFFLVAYDFKTKAMALSTEFISSLSFGERVSLCRSYAKTLSYFHNNEPPIYHRFLSYKSAYYADERDKGFNKIRTALVKFEHAKIAANVPTVFKTVMYGEYTTQNDEQRYIASEWNDLKKPDNKEWENIDIFSLGMLFTDILMGKIGGYDKAEVDSNPDIRPFAGLISAMTGDAEKRPDINSVIKQIGEIVNENGVNK